MSSDESRAGSHPPFWDERYAANEHLFGGAPNAFAASEADRIPRGSDVLELGAGEGRTLLWLADNRGVDGTAIDFSVEALTAGRRWAEREGLPLETVRADVRSWRPSRQWDAVIITFLQLLPDERPDLYETIRQSLRPGGVLIAEWFRPAHLSSDYDRLGPSTADRMVPPEELTAAFADDEILLCEAAGVELKEGPILRGHAAVVRFIVRRDSGQE